MAAVNLKGVFKSFGSTRVVHGVDISIADGEFCVLVGPSGCGKSTLLRMIAGLEEISGGEIEIGGRVVNKGAPEERDIAMVFQNYALYPHMTVFDNMAFSMKLAGQSRGKIRERVEVAANILGLTEYLERYPRQLSGGQRQRVAMGRAIVCDPQGFLFDEPLSNLDAKLRVQMRTEIKELHQRLTTTSIYVTHDQIEAMTMADKIVVMNAGKTEQVGSPLDLYDNPANLFVAGFIGSPAMNFLKGKLVRNGAGMQGRKGAKWWWACAPSTCWSGPTGCARKWWWSSPPAPTRRSSAKSAAPTSLRWCASAIRSSRARRYACIRNSPSCLIRQAGQDCSTNPRRFNNEQYR